MTEAPAAAPAAAAPSATPAPIQVTPVGQAPAAQSSGGSAPSDWTSGLNDDLKGYVSNKGFRDPTSVVDSYRNLEKLMGAPRERLLKLPENMDEPGAMNEIYGKLGRPEKPEGYGIETPKENGNPEFVKWAGGTFHELGLTQKQGQALVAKWNDFMAGEQKNMADQTAAQNQAAHDGLKKKWGAAFDQNVMMAKAATREFQIAPEVLDKMENAMGFGGLMEFLHTVGSKIGEPSFHTGQSAGSSMLTPEGAQNKISALRQDREFVKRYTSGDSTAKAEMDRLHKMAYPD